MKGNLIFLVGATLEVIALQLGVDSWAVALSLIAYGVVLVGTGYLS